MCVSPQFIGAVGLVLDIAGVVMLFYYGPPSLPITKDGHTILPFNANDNGIQAKNKVAFHKHQRFSFIALGLLLAGFVLQFVSNVLQIPV
ncbi:MAG TPA: hypothetical protein VJ280_06895 [Dehalococcoidales bacterium]|nr:hypothetical protein [Dehalococcoidales bacterium]